RRLAPTVSVPPRSDAMTGSAPTREIASVRRQPPIRRSLARVRPRSELPLDKGSPPSLEWNIGLHKSDGPKTNRTLAARQPIVIRSKGLTLQLSPGAGYAGSFNIDHRRRSATPL